MLDAIDSLYGTVVPLASGGTAAIYRLHHPDRPRDLAAKVLRYDDASLNARLCREARALASIDHPHICRYHSVGRLLGRPCLVMELIEGTNLLEARRALRQRAKIEAMKQVAEAVHAAHQAGVIHRDIKPQNIMLRGGAIEPVDAVLVDFGLVWSTDEETQLTHQGQLLGTPVYMAPEQIENPTRAHGARVDVYGLGATLYHLLTGRPPFQADNQFLVLEQVLRAEVVPLRKHDASLPPALEAIVLRCLAKNPDDRYASAAAVAEALGALLAPAPRLGWTRALSRTIATTAGKTAPRIGSWLMATIALAMLFLQPGPPRAVDGPREAPRLVAPAIAAPAAAIEPDTSRADDKIASVNAA
ncbi:MAG: serine/threonine-protein kinase [Acidobacteriota bacterium]